jgi:hypothetical protein
MALLGAGQVSCNPCSDGRSFPYNYITSFGTGTGGNGTYNLAYSQTESGSGNLFSNPSTHPQAFHYADMNTVYNSSYTPTPVANNQFDMISLSSPFTWDGTSNILVDLCYTGAGFSTSRYFNSNSGVRWSSNSNCNLDVTGSSTGGPPTRPKVGFTFDSSTPPSWNNTANVAFTGISLSVGTSTATSVQNNTIQNIGMSGTGASSFTGINATTGLYNIGTTTGNIIGDVNTSNSILVAGTGVTTGIASASASAISIANNTVANLTASGTGTGVAVRGIATSSSGIYTINSNIVRNLSTASSSTGTGASSSVVGISHSATGSGAYVSNNTVFALSNTAASANVAVTGIFYSGAISGTNNVQANLVHSFSTSSSSVTSQQTGIAATGGLTTYSNNMVRLGIDIEGNAQSVTPIIAGISKASTNNMNFYHNSVYIGGSGVGTGAANTFAFTRTASGTDNVRNNIFVNARSNASTGGKHYAVAYNNNTNLTSNYNIYFTSGNGGFIGSYNGGTTEQTTLQGLTFASGGNQETASGFGDPNFVNPTAAIPDLHIQGTTPAESAGILISQITTDIDGQTRIGLTPVDIGADAGNFTPLDIFRPIISVSSIPNQAICGGSLSIEVTATISDIGISGIATGTFAPKLWWRLSSGTWASLAHSSVIGQQYTFQLEISNAEAGQTYQYYVVAQDLATVPNLGYSHFNASTPIHSSVNDVVTPNSNPASFTVLSANPLSGTVTVGTGGDYTNFNNASTGLFNAINTRGLGGNLEVLVISDISESADYMSLGVITEYCGNNFTITIKPSAAVLRTIQSNTFAANPLLHFSGSKRVIIDGSYDGSGRFLLFRQQSTQSCVGTSVPTVYFQGTVNTSVSDIAIRSCIIEGNNRLTACIGPGVINFGNLLASGQGIHDITIDNNIIRNRSDLTQNSGNTPWTLIQIGHPNSVGIQRYNISITNNELLNFGESAIQIRQNNSGNGIGNNFVISGNKIYQPINNPTWQYPVWLEGGANSIGHVVSNNKIGGNDSPNPDITGTWTNNKTDGEVIAIFTRNGGTESSGGVIISDNIISNISLIGQDYTNFMGIRNQTGFVEIRRNTIQNIQNSGGGDAFDLTANTANIGIWSQSSAGAIIDNNLVNNMSTPNINKRFLYMTGIQHGSNQYYNGVNFTNLPGGRVTISNNTILNLACASGLQSPTISPDALIGIFTFSANGTTGNIIENNLVYNINGTLLNAFDTKVWGIGIGLGGYGSTQSGIIRNNRIFDINNANTGDNTEVNGLAVGGGNWQVYNNMISLDNSDYPSVSPFIVGIYDWTTVNRTSAFYNNSVYIGGTSTSSAKSSYAYLRLPDGTGLVWGANVTLRNNIFFNNRTGSGSNNIAIGNLTQGNSSDATVGWNSNYNFLLTRNTSQVGRWAGGSGGDRNFANWITTSGGDQSSWSVQAANSSSNTQLLYSDLFEDISLGILRINTDNQASWFVNGKGIALTDIPNDFYGNSRSTTFGFGTDIGAVEFTPLTSVLPHQITATPGLGITNTFSFAGRQLASITWGGSGTVPSSVALRYYSGSNPVNNFPAGINKTNWYMNITPTGGSGFSYSLSIFYDDALLGSMLSEPSNESKMIISKTEEGNWIDIATSTVSTTANILAASGLTMFSDFVGKDEDAPLPVSLLYLRSTCYQEGITVYWATASEINNDYFTLERSEDGYSWTKIAQIKGNGNTNAVFNYVYKDLSAQSYTQYFYRLKQTDYDGTTVLLSTIAESCDAIDNMFEIITVFQNEHILNIHFRIPYDDDIIIELIDMLGKPLYIGKSYNYKGFAEHAIDINNLTKNSIYMIRLSNRNESIYRRHFIAYW